MNTNYKKAVVVFGLVLPLLLIALLTGLVLHAKGRVEETYAKRNASYQKNSMLDLKVAKLRQELALSEDAAKRDEELLKSVDRRSFTKKWKDVGGSFKSNEFGFSLPVWKPGGVGLGSGQGSSASLVTMTFSGTYRAMQEALVEVESDLPQMQMNSMVIVPDANAEKLNFKTSFTLWTQN